VELDDLEVRGIEPDRTLLGVERRGDVLRPPLAVGARVAVAEPDDPLVLLRDEEDEVLAERV
jgi:hypothetical protein